MYVYIGSYVSRCISRVHERYMDRKYPDGLWPRYAENGEPPFDEVVMEVLEDALQWVYNHTINLYLDRKERKIKVNIDRYDVWNMDVTLAYIILPMLKEIQKSKNGSPFVDDEDVPENLRSTSASPKENDWDIDDNHHKRWDWVISEMIWTFEEKQKGNWEDQYYEYELFDPIQDSADFQEQIGVRLVWEDLEGRKAHQARMNNGFRLFGKYYENLWT